MSNRLYPLNIPQDFDQATKDILRRSFLAHVDRMPKPGYIEHSPYLGLGVYGSVRLKYIVVKSDRKEYKNASVPLKQSRKVTKLES